MMRMRHVLGKKKHLCLTTGTSSGKSLAFALPILEAYRRDPNSKALVLFPTKALAQDQLGKLQKLFQQVCPGLGVCTFDGDTPKDDRARLLKSSNVFLTNPDMLHFTILSSHLKWRHVLENLRHVVLDEAHVYRGSFGSHAALLLRRFRRVLKHYKTSPLFIACSATMCNAGAFFTKLLALEPGEEVCVVDEDTAGRGDRQFCLWNPPLLEALPGQPSREEQNARKRARHSEREGPQAAPRLPPGPGYKTRSSPYEEAAWLLAQAARRGHRTVCFLQVRALVEIILQASLKHLDDRPDLQARIAGYRGDSFALLLTFSQPGHRLNRRKLERRLFTGDLLCVIATNALELGIDIGDLDLTLHVGIPHTVASIWQQAGRAGRRGRPSAAILIAMDAPLEQHFCRNPDEFFLRSIEARVPDTSNELLLKEQIIFGWSSSLAILTFMAGFAQNLADEGNFATYMMLLMVMCFFYIFSDDPPQQVVTTHSASDVVKVMWKVMQTKVMNIIAFIAAPSTLQNSVGTFAGNATFLIGVYLFRRHFMHRNWRMTFVWTAGILALNNGFQLMVIYNAWGVGQDGWFYAFGSNILMIIQGIAQVLSSLAVVEISPAGYEASVYEFLTSIHNAGITLNSNLQNLFVPIFDLHGIAQSYFPTKTNPHPPQQLYNSHMAHATYFTMAVNLLGALTFCWFLPQQKEQCKDWAEELGKC
eukprot:g14747.t1